MKLPGQQFEVLRDVTLHTVKGETIQVRKDDLVEYLGNYIFGGSYQSDPIPEDHFRLLGGSQPCDEDHPHHGAEGTFDLGACDWGIVRRGYLAPFE